MDTNYTAMQLFGIARNCFQENCDKTSQSKDNLSFNLNRGLLALVDAVEAELQHIHSKLGRIEHR
jgi:hypothetical protein